MIHRILFLFSALAICTKTFADSRWFDRIFQETNPLIAMDIISDQPGFSLEEKKNGEIKGDNIIYSGTWSFKFDNKTSYLTYKNKTETGEVSLIFFNLNDTTLESIKSDFIFCKNHTSRSVYLRKLDLGEKASYTFWIGNMAAHSAQLKETEIAFPHEEFVEIKEASQLDEHFGNFNIPTNKTTETVSSIVCNGDYMFDDMFQINDMFKIEGLLQKNKSYSRTYSGIDRQKYGMRKINIYDTYINSNKCFLTIEYYLDQKIMMLTFGCPEKSTLEDVENTFKYCRSKTSRDIYLRRTKYEVSGMSYSFFIANPDGLELYQSMIANSKMTKLFRIDDITQLKKYYK